MKTGYFFIGLFVILFHPFVMAQNKSIASTKAQERLKTMEQRQRLISQSVASGIEFRSVGPTVMSGRVTALSVSPNDASHFYVAYASGGLWETKNNGASFTPLFDGEMVMTIGDIAVNWAAETPVIWVGTGENNSSRSSYSGVGMYKSADGGKKWEYMGLPESHHIGRIALHPTNADIAWVAVLGHLYSPNKERGIYKTTDGGKTWKQTLFVDENTGGIDLVVDAKNPDVLYAAMWHRERRAWNFVEGGTTSGIYKSINGGNDWVNVSGNNSGFASGKIGRIGLALHPSGILFACLDNQNLRPKKADADEDSTKIDKDDLKKMSKDEFLKLEKWKLKDFLTTNRFPEKYDADEITKQVKDGKITPQTLVEYLEDANANLFDTPVIGAEVYQSDNGGKDWKKVNKDFIDDLYYSYGYYFAQIRVAPQSTQKIYLLGVPIVKSEDGGQTFVSINGDNVHADHHALWINPNQAGHLINGNDGGVNISYDDGKNWIKCNTPPVGQFYAIAADMEQPFNLYGGLQDNGVWTGSSQYQSGVAWHQSGNYPYKELLGGDGMQIAIDKRNKNIVYTGFQFGNYYRIDRSTDDYTPIAPKHDLGERPLRFNWETPICLSVYNQDILYFGTNKLHRSMDKGDNWTTISGDLTKGGKPGNVPYGTLTTISESPHTFGLIYVGTDDGYIHLTKDGGNTWARLSDKLPQDLWVSSLQASPHDAATVFVALNGYRWDNFVPYIYVSEDFGKTWKQIGTDLPNEPVNVVRQDPVNPNLLYVGTDHGLYISLDKGKTFQRMDSKLPAVAVHDLLIHPRDKELAVATHGRSLYLANVEHLQLLTPEIMVKPLFVFDIPSTKYNRNWGRIFSAWEEPRLPKVEIPIYLDQPDSISISVFMPKSKEHTDSLFLTSMTVKGVKGINYLPYDLSIDEQAVEAYQTRLKEGVKEDEPPVVVKKADNGKYYLQQGSYTLVIKAGKHEEEATVTVK